MSHIFLPGGVCILSITVQNLLMYRRKIIENMFLVVMLGFITWMWVTVNQVRFYIMEKRVRRRENMETELNSFIETETDRDDSNLI